MSPAAGGAKHGVTGEVRSDDHSIKIAQSFHSEPAFARMSIILDTHEAEGYVSRAIAFLILLALAMTCCHVLFAFVLLARLAVCSDNPPAPPVTPAPDTTSHD